METHKGSTYQVQLQVVLLTYVKVNHVVSNPDDFDINLVSTPGVVRRLHSYVFDKIVDMVEARSDAFFIGDVVGQNDTIGQPTTQFEAVDHDSNYGTYYPWVKTIDYLLLIS